MGRPRIQVNPKSGFSFTAEAQTDIPMGISQRSRHRPGHKVWTNQEVTWHCSLNDSFKRCYWLLGNLPSIPVVKTAQTAAETFTCVSMPMCVLYIYIELKWLVAHSLIK